jgi:hypothetical protein
MKTGEADMVLRTALDRILLTDRSAQAGPLNKDKAQTWGSFNDQVARSLEVSSQACATPLPH